ncbi:MAG: hypothetical protein P1P82_04745 [Bacteroidales bacterium]|nr:hypothetical protein [Bacteroidales bacterium]MDT8433061.1 hypothetical protein [Bacteroidales bacterium]
MSQAFSDKKDKPNEKIDQTGAPGEHADTDEIPAATGVLRWM